jgi:hypothetical protein
VRVHDADGVPDTQVRRWIGAGFLPGHFGDWGATSPGVVLELVGSGLTLRLRPRFLARLMGVAPLTAEPSSGLTVTATKRRGSWGWFIEFRLPGDKPYVFQTLKVDEVLSCMAQAGFTVPVERA